MLSQLLRNLPFLGYLRRYPNDRRLDPYDNQETLGYVLKTRMLRVQVLSSVLPLDTKDRVDD